MTTPTRTHWRKAMETPYLNVSYFDPSMLGINLTIARVICEIDLTERTKELMNSAYFVETEIQPGVKLPPMPLNVMNCKFLTQLTGSAFIDDWTDVPVHVSTRQTRWAGKPVDGLQLSKPVAPPELKFLTPTHNAWAKAIVHCRNGAMDTVYQHFQIRPADLVLLQAAAQAPA